EQGRPTEARAFVGHKKGRAGCDGCADGISLRGGKFGAAIVWMSSGTDRDARGGASANAGSSGGNSAQGGSNAPDPNHQEGWRQLRQLVQHIGISQRMQRVISKTFRRGKIGP